MMLAVIPLVTLAVMALVGTVAVAGFGVYAKSGEAMGGLNWEPVWLGGPEPWGIKIYQDTRSFPTRYRGWRAEVLLYGEFCHDKMWRGVAGKYLTEEYVRQWALRWIEKNPGGCP